MLNHLHITSKLPSVKAIESLQRSCLCCQITALLTDPHPIVSARIDCGGFYSRWSSNRSTLPITHVTFFIIQAFSASTISVDQVADHLFYETGKNS